MKTRLFVLVFVCLFSDVNSTGPTQILFELIRSPNCNFKHAHSLMCQGAASGDRDLEGNTPLHIACKYARGVRVLKLLLDGVVNAMNIQHQSPLHCLCLSGKANAAQVRFLLKHGASVHARDAYGNTPLLLAAYGKSSIKVLATLVSAGAAVDARNAAGEDIVGCASLNGDARYWRDVRDWLYPDVADYDAIADEGVFDLDV